MDATIGSIANENHSQAISARFLCFMRLRIIPSTLCFAKMLASGIREADIHSQLNKRSILGHLKKKNRERK
jgi:hypothetical protein